MTDTSIHDYWIGFLNASLKTNSKKLRKLALKVNFLCVEENIVNVTVPHQLLPIYWKERNNFFNLNSYFRYKSIEYKWIPKTIFELNEFNQFSFIILSILKRFIIYIFACIHAFLMKKILMYTMVKLRLYLRLICVYGCLDFEHGRPIYFFN